MTHRAEYRRLVRELARAAAQRDSDLADAERSYEDGVAALRADLVAARGAVASSAAAVAAATATVEEADRETERIWAALRGQLGIGRRSRLGDPPAPSFTGESTVDEARALLASAAALVSTVGAPVSPLPRRATALLPLVGAACAVAVGLVAGGLATLAGTGVSVLTVAAWITFLLAPFSGLPVARFWARHRWSARLDTGAVGLTVLGGMVACSVLVLALR